MYHLLSLHQKCRRSFIAYKQTDRQTDRQEVMSSCCRNTERHTNAVESEDNRLQTDKQTERPPCDLNSVTAAGPQLPSL